MTGSNNRLLHPFRPPISVCWSRTSNSSFSGCESVSKDPTGESTRFISPKPDSHPSLPFNPTASRRRWD